MLRLISVSAREVAKNKLKMALSCGITDFSLVVEEKESFFSTEELLNEIGIENIIKMSDPGPKMAAAMAM